VSEVVAEEEEEEEEEEEGVVERSERVWVERGGEGKTLCYIIFAKA